MNPSNRKSLRGKVTNEGSNNGNSKESQSKIPRRLSTRSSSSSRLSDMRHLSLEPSRLIRSKSTLSTTPMAKYKSMNPQELFPQPAVSECSDRLVPTPRSSKRQVNGSAAKNAQRCKEGDTRPFNDKKWQQSQLLKIQHYLQRDKLKNSNFDEYSLRPLSINTFIEICNLFFTKLDSKLIITKENYVEELPFILRLLGYPSSQNLKKSLMKAVNIPRNWPMAIGILSWIVELVEGIEYLDYEAHIPSRSKIVANAVFDSYKMMCNSAKDYDAISIDHVYHQLLENENLTVDDFNRIRKQIDELEIKYESLCNEENKLLEIQNVYANKKNLIISMQQKMTENENLKQITLNEIKQHKINISENEYTLDKLINEKEILLRKIKTQCVDKEEYLAILNNCSQLEQDIASLNKLIDNLMEFTYAEQLKLKRNNDRIIALSEEFNKKCLSNITKLNSFAVYDIALMNPNTHNILSELKKKMTKTLEEQLQESDKLDLEAVELSELNIKMEQLNIIDGQEIPRLKHENEILREKIEKNRNAIQNYQFEIDEHINQLKEYDSKINGVKNMKKLLISESEKLFAKMEQQYFEYGNASLKRLQAVFNQLDDSVNELQKFLPQ